MSFQQGQGYKKDTKILRSEWRGVGILTDTVLGSHFCSVFHTLLSTRSYPGIDYRLRLGQFFSGVMGKASHGDPSNPMPGACPSWGLYSFWLMLWLFLGSPKPHAVDLTAETQVRPIVWFHIRKKLTRKCLRSPHLLSMGTERDHEPGRFPISGRLITLCPSFSMQWAGMLCLH